MGKSRPKRIDEDSRLSSCSAGFLVTGRGMSLPVLGSRPGMILVCLVLDRSVDHCVGGVADLRVFLHHRHMATISSHVG